MKLKILSLMLVVLLSLTAIVSCTSTPATVPGASAEFSNLHLKGDLFVYNPTTDAYVKITLPLVQGSVKSFETGTATLAASSTSIAVTHGAATTPIRVFITPRSNTGTVSSSTAANPAYVPTASISATSFNITTAVSTNTSTLFDWIVFTEEG